MKILNWADPGNESKYFMNFIEILVLSLVEGITEFLPISSTGHLIIFAHFFGLSENEFTIAFNVIIQFGAILSVLVLYYKRFFASIKIYQNLLISVLPAVIIGFAVKDVVDVVLSSVKVVAVAFISGGIILILSDSWFKDNHNKNSIEQLSIKQSLVIGLIQCFAFIPGMSRSASAIIGGMVSGLSRKDATEYSFFLAVPTLSGAALLKTIKIVPTIEPEQITVLAWGLMFSFIFALLAIRFLIHTVSRYGFKYYGYYRIALGLALLFLIR